MDIKSTWGEIKNEERVPQITRAMIELRNPKPYDSLHVPEEILTPEPKNNSVKNYSSRILCFKTIHCIRLQIYNQKLQELVTALENITTQVQFTSMDEILALKQDLPVRPTLIKQDDHSYNQDDLTLHELMLNEETLHTLTRKSAASIAAYTGFAHTDDECLNVLADVMKTFIASFTDVLRNVLDNEALTGKTNFFDAIDSTCNNSIGTNMPKLLNWWRDKYLRKVDDLEAEANALEERLRKLKESKKNIGFKNQGNFIIKKEPFHSEAFSGTYGKWTPVLESAAPSHLQSPISYQMDVKTEDPNAMLYSYSTG